MIRTLYWTAAHFYVCPTPRVWLINYFVNFPRAFTLQNIRFQSNFALPVAAVKHFNSTSNDLDTFLKEAVVLKIVQELNCDLAPLAAGSSVLVCLFELV